MISAAAKQMDAPTFKKTYPTIAGSDSNAVRMFFTLTEESRETNPESDLGKIG